MARQKKHTREKQGLYVTVLIMMCSIIRKLKTIDAGRRHDTRNEKKKVLCKLLVKNVLRQKSL